METFFVLSENDVGNKYGLHTLRGKETLELEVGGSHLLSQICWRVGRTSEVPGEPLPVVYGVITPVSRGEISPQLSIL